MKLNEIKTLENLLNYCKYNDERVETLPHTPNATQVFPIECYNQNKSGSIKIYKLPLPIDNIYSTCKGIKGFIFSYDTPIGVLKQDKVYVLNNCCLRLSHTTDIILDDFNKIFSIIRLDSLIHICIMLNIDMGYLKDAYREDFKYGC